MAGRHLPPALSMANFAMLGTPDGGSTTQGDASESRREVHLHSNFGDYRISRDGLRGHDPTALALDDIQLHRRHLLGKGSSGDVFGGVHRPTGRQLAIKQIPLFDHHNQDSVIKELTALNAEKSRYIVEFFGAYYDHENGSILIALERMAGSLQRFVSLAPLSEDVLVAVAVQCLRALAVLHDRGVLHRDVKPSNILYDSSGQIKLADFGIASMPVGTHHAHTFIGTLAYMSPERVRGRAYTHSADVWGLGLVLYVLAAGEHPFKRAETWRLHKLFDECGVFQLPDAVAARYRGPVQPFIRAMLTVEQDKRADVATLLADPFLASAASLPDGDAGLLGPVAALLPRVAAIEKAREAEREAQLVEGLKGVVGDMRRGSGKGGAGGGGSASGGGGGRGGGASDGAGDGDDGEVADGVVRGEPLSTGRRGSGAQSRDPPDVVGTVETGTKGARLSCSDSPCRCGRPGCVRCSGSGAAALPSNSPPTLSGVDGFPSPSPPFGTTTTPGSPTHFGTSGREKAAAAAASAEEVGVNAQPDATSRHHGEVGHACNSACVAAVVRRDSVAEAEGIDYEAYGIPPPGGLKHARGGSRDRSVPSVAGGGASAFKGTTFLASTPAGEGGASCGVTPAAQASVLVGAPSSPKPRGSRLAQLSTAANALRAGRGGGAVGATDPSRGGARLTGSSNVAAS